jgi:hypothetical protein
MARRPTAKEQSAEEDAQREEPGDVEEGVGEFDGEGEVCFGDWGW